MTNFYIKSHKPAQRSLLAAAAAGVLKSQSTLDHLTKTDISRLQAIVTEYKGTKEKPLEVSKHAVRLDKVYAICVRNIGDLVISENEIKLVIDKTRLCSSIFSDLADIEPKLIDGQNFFVSRFSFSRRNSTNLRLFMAITECSGVEVFDSKSEVLAGNSDYDDKVTHDSIVMTYTCRTNTARYMRAMHLSLNLNAESLKVVYHKEVEA